MNQLLQVLMSTIKAKIVPIWTKLKYWTSKSFIESKLLSWVRDKLAHLFDVKPKDKHDYFAVRNWLISRKLAFSIVISVGIISICVLLTTINPVGNMQGEGATVYWFNSIPLRFVEGPVRIKARSGYIAYDGHVSDGYASGYGMLYNKNEQLVYAGNFERSQYNGNGTLYYATGETKYKGEFVDNQFEGTGILYRQNGSKLYEGEFLAGLREGNGSLYDSGDNKVFEGSFHCGNIVYNQFLGKNTSDIGALYTGNSCIYTYREEAVVCMEDIQAMYVIDNNKNSIEEGATVQQIYVLSDVFAQGQAQITNMEQVSDILGAPSFEGNSYIIFPEAVAIHQLQEIGKMHELDAGLVMNSAYDELKVVDSFQKTQELYLYVYQIEEVTYTFFCKQRDGAFFMYSIEQQ